MAPTCMKYQSKLIYLLLLLFAKFSCGLKNHTKSSRIQNNGSSEHVKEDGDNCWVSLKAPELFSSLETLEKRFETTIVAAQKNIEDKNDQIMLDAKLFSRGIAEISKKNATYHTIPSGLNFGGNIMLRMLNSIIFIHQLKLSNDTQFVINNIQNDLKNMVVNIDLSLNDLGAYYQL